MSRVTFHDTRWAPSAYRESVYLAAWRAKVALAALECSSQADAIGP